MVSIHSFTFNPLQENTYVLWDESNECIVIDPGCYDEEERSELAGFLAEKKLTLKFIINTHCHIDHVLGNYFLKEKYKVKLGIHKIEEAVLRAVKVYAPSYGIFNYQEASPDFFIEPGKDIQFGNSVLEVIFVPGHSPGHVAFFLEKQKICISGDVLFFQSIGRTDLPGGNYQTLLNSIRNALFPLGDDVKIYPGHGPYTTIGQEKRSNPFLQN